MAIGTEDVRRHALALADDERAELAAELLASLDGPSDDDDAQTLWAQELERRALAVIAGESRVVPWETARDSIAGELSG